MKKSGRKRKMIYGLAVVLAIVLYEVVGMLVPFIHMKRVSSEYRESVEVSDFYATEQEQSAQRAYVAETNEEALSFRLDMIDKAEYKIAVSTFDIRPGKSTDDTFAALYAAAERGVKVQILVDGMYGMLHMKNLPVFYAAGMHPNVEIRFYNRPDFLKPWTIHGRMHDKYVLVDDKYLFMGGRNMFDYFVGDYTKSKGYDREVLVTDEGQTRNGAVSQAWDYFNQMWVNEVCRTVYEETSASRRGKVDEAIQKLQNHYRSMDIETIDYDRMTVPVQKATFIHNPTHIYGKEPHVFEQLRQLMMSAKERVVINTPYIVCSDDMYEGLAEVARTLPEAELLINSIAAGDNVCASSDYLRNKDRVLDLGFDTYEYMGDHSLHGKSVLIDNNISVIGSYNFDNRSTYVDTETMLVIDSVELNSQLDSKLTDIKNGSLLAKDENTYQQNTSVYEKKLPANKERLIRILSVVIGGFRYLI